MTSIEEEANTGTGTGIPIQSDSKATHGQRSPKNNTSTNVVDSHSRFTVNATNGTPTALYNPKLNISTHRDRFHHLKMTSYETQAVVDEQAWYVTYGSTTALLSLVHAFYLRRLWCVGWNQRRRRSRSQTTTQHTLVNYHKVVRRKRFYLLICAVINHHPSVVHRSTISSDHSALHRNQADVPIADQSETHMTSTSSERLSILQQSATFLRRKLLFLQSRWQSSLIVRQFRPGNVLHGLTGLFYCAHCLWACRALEVIYHGTKYARVLWTLTWTAFALDFALTYLALTILREINFASSAPLLMVIPLWDSNDNSRRESSSTVASRVERTLTHRSVGGLTATTTAVLCLFYDHFDTPVPIFPLFSNKGAILEFPPVSVLIILIILLRLSHSTHPVMGVACGAISGMFWLSRWTPWLAEPFWCYGILIFFLFSCLLSLSAHCKIYLPCVDYTPWNTRGNVVSGVDEGEVSTGMNGTSDEASDDSQSGDSIYIEEGEDNDSIELPLSNRPRHTHPRISTRSIYHSGDTDVDADTGQAALISVASISMTRRPRRGTGR